jgi:aminoglycoside phosphotransferase (APT) family kinase protein
VKEAIEAALGTRVEHVVQLAGGASKEAWAVDTAAGERLLVRRAGGGVIHRQTLTLRDEFTVLVAAREAGVRVPEPIAYLGEVEGREAFAMARVEGETIGRRIVRDPPSGLGLELAEELARIHAIAAERLPFLPAGLLWDTLYADLDAVAEPHPAIEYGLAWCRERLPLERPRVVSHGDFRLGNIAVGPDGLVAVLDWEFAHLSDPAEDLAWPFVRAWRFGADDRRLGGVDDVEPYLERYAELTGHEIPLDELYAWEVLGNCKWAIGALGQTRRHLSGEGRDVEYAILGRLAAEMEYELLDLIEKAA